MAGEREPIRELVESWARSSWALALFGVSQLGKVFQAGRAGRQSGEASDAFDSVVRVIEAQLSGEMRMIFRIGDQLQKGAMDMAWCALTGGDDDIVRRAMKTAFDMAESAAGAASMWMPGRESRLAWLELQNKLEVYNLFAHVDLAAELPRASSATLPELVARASSLGPYRSVWATEGVGHFYAESARGGGQAAALELKGQVGSLPASSLVALHAGAGLSFAGYALKALTPRSPEAEVRRALEQFVALCRASSHDGYVGAAYEALGLWTRNLHPQLVPSIDHQLAETGEELVGYFWHGVGRALYFAPTNVLPNGGAPWPAVSVAQHEPPHELGRLNALSGLVWALALVNVRHPEVLECFLKQHGRELAQDGAFVNGLNSALIIWRDSSPDDAYPDALCGHRPADPEVAELWDDQVRRPCAAALGHYYRVLKDKWHLGHVFRYQSLPDLVGSLERQQA